MKLYVLCSECKKPDTILIKENRMTFVKCEACGARKRVEDIKLRGFWDVFLRKMSLSLILMNLFLVWMK